MSVRNVCWEPTKPGLPPGVRLLGGGGRTIQFGAGWCQFQPRQSIRFSSRRARKEGRLMSLDRAVAYALESVDVP
jgi:hypothetical protein